MNIQDFNYQRAVDALIPEAEIITARRIKRRRKNTRVELREGKDGKMYKHCYESQFFHEEMNKLKRENGLIA